MSAPSDPPPRRRPLGGSGRARLAVAAVGGLALGLAVGRSAVPDPGPAARVAVEASALPLALDADAIWTSGALGAPSVAEGIAALSAGDPSVVAGGAAAWLEAHDSVLVRIAGIELPGEARPIQRQLLVAIALSRDAIEVLERAAGLPAGAHRDDLVVEVLRLRQRSEGLLLAARASVDELDGARRRIALPAPVRAFRDEG